LDCQYFGPKKSRHYIHITIRVLYGLDTAMQYVAMDLGPFIYYLYYLKLVKL
jgi:hypothetical protein